MVSWIETLVPHMTLVEEPPIASASEVLGSRFEKVFVSELGAPSRTGTPFSSTNKRRRRLGVELKISEWISPLLELFNAEAPGPVDLEDRMKSPLLLVGTSDSWRTFPFVARVGLELEA